jgi:hypothetical protein
MTAQSDTGLPENTAQLLLGIDYEWSKLMELVDPLTQEQMTTPDEGGWSPKDNLAHLMEWMKAMLGHHIDRRPAHEVMDLPQELTEPWGNFDGINAALFARNRDRSSEDVLGDLKATYTEVITRLQGMPFEDLMKPRHDDDPKKRPLILWVLSDTSEHFAEHRANIEKAVGKDA